MKYLCYNENSTYICACVYVLRMSAVDISEMAYRDFLEFAQTVLKLNTKLKCNENVAREEMSR